MFKFGEYGEKSGMRLSGARERGDGTKGPLGKREGRGGKKQRGGGVKGKGRKKRDEGERGGLNGDESKGMHSHDRLDRF